MTPEVLEFLKYVGASLLTLLTGGTGLIWYMKNRLEITTNHESEQAQRQQEQMNAYYERMHNDLEAMRDQSTERIQNLTDFYEARYQKLAHAFDEQSKQMAALRNDNSVEIAELREQVGQERIAKADMYAELQGMKIEADTLRHQLNRLQEESEPLLEAQV